MCIRPEEDTVTSSKKVFVSSLDNSKKINYKLPNKTSICQLYESKRRTGQARFESWIVRQCTSTYTVKKRLAIFRQCSRKLREVTPLSHIQSYNPIPNILPIIVWSLYDNHPWSLSPVRRCILFALNHEANIRSRRLYIHVLILHGICIVKIWWGRAEWRLPPYPCSFPDDPWFFFKTLILTLV